MALVSISIVGLVLHFQQYACFLFGACFVNVNNAISGNNIVVVKQINVYVFDDED